MNNNAETVKSQIDIVSLVSQYVEIKKSGSNYKGLCPFHNEKGASFMVNQNLQIYKCFGCGESGDVISFVQKIEGLDFKSTINFLSEKYGIKIEIEKETSENKDKKRLYEINNLALEFFQYILNSHPSGKIAKDYLTEKRKLNEATIKEFQIGYAPKGWNNLTDLLKKRGFTQQEIISSSLGVSKKNGGVYDKFRGRVVFPYFSLDGKCIGFMGRTIFNEDPKYLNSSETLVFKKGEFLYGLNKTKLELKKHGAILVEGTLDFLKPYQYGIKNLCATSGTALTPKQLELLKRYTDKIFFCFDSDNAGVNAILKGIEIADKYSFDVRVLQIPKPYKDLDEYFDSKPEEAVNISQSSININDFFLSYLYKKYGIEEASSKNKIINEFRNFYQKINNEVTKNHYLKKVSEDLDLDQNIVLKSLNQNLEIPIKEVASSSPNPQKTEVGVKYNSKEAFFMSVLLKSGIDSYNPIVLKLSDESFEEPLLRNLYIKYRSYSQNNKGPIDIRQFSNTLNEGENKLLENLTLLDIEIDLSSDEKINNELEKLSDLLIANYKKRQIKDITQKLKKAEKEKDTNKVKILMEELNQLI
ncbi:DNA primase [bacterium]|nr:DNA primase [bacterium]